MPHYFEFDSFRVDAEQRLLWRDGEPVALEPKTFETLLVLLKHQGEVLGKDELMDEIWQDVEVGEDSLSQQISRLRKSLGEKRKVHRFIVTVPGVGYKFVAQVREVEMPNNENSLVAQNVESSLSEKNNGENTPDFRPKAKIAADGNGRIAPITMAHIEQPAAPKAVSQRFRKFFDWRILAVAVLVSAVIGAVVYFRQQPRTTNALGVNSIAVLPFKTIGDEQSNESLKMGMTDALITRLSRIEKIKVSPSSSVARFNKPDQDPIAAGRELGVDTVLEGRVQQNGDRLRVTAQLIRTNDDKVLWSEIFDNEFADIFDVQHSISHKIAEALSLELSDEEKHTLMKRYTTSAEAYRLFLDANYLWQRRADGEARAVARKNYQRAIELDPKFALAYVGLANMQVDEPDPESYRKMRTLAEQALEIDPTLGEAHEALGFALWRGEGNWAEAAPHFKRAIELSPNDRESYHSYSMILAGQGKFDEALAVLDSMPNKPDYPLAYKIAVLYFARDYDKTIELCQERLAKKPNDIGALSYLAPAYSEKGMHAEAIRTAEQYANFDRLAGAGALVYLGFAYAKAGQKEKAREIVRQMTRGNAPPAAQLHGALAMLYGEIEERDKAFEHLEKSIERREWWAFTLKVAPYWDSLRDDARFDEMLRRINSAS